MSTVESYHFEVSHIVPGAVASILRYQRYRWQRKEFVLLLLEDYDQNAGYIVTGAFSSVCDTLLVVVIFPPGA